MFWKGGREEWREKNGLAEQAFLLNISPQTNLRLENGGFGMMRETSPTSKAQAFSGEVTLGRRKWDLEVFVGQKTFISLRGKMG